MPTINQKWLDRVSRQRAALNTPEQRRREQEYLRKQGQSRYELRLAPQPPPAIDPTPFAPEPSPALLIPRVEPALRRFWH